VAWEWFHQADPKSLQTTGEDTLKYLAPDNGCPDESIKQIDPYPAGEEIT